MNELHVLYTFLALMTFNLLATLVYLVGFGGLKRAFAPQKTRARQR